jgi:hypothetical protein
MDMYLARSLFKIMQRNTSYLSAPESPAMEIDRGG